ncbi:ATP-binding protein [Roseibium sp. RKSG952]|uniref:ATP-binding protein n=1 Tax=Roseibium sp. RKSG952 TaxID=2529384 RepID=UPI0012BC832C|nr:hypothetical protein [Roseibium sp. RKSG952]
MILFARVPVVKRRDIIGDPTVADAMLDRIIHNTHRFTLEGGSMRNKNRRHHSHNLKATKLKLNR